MEHACDVASRWNSNYTKRKNGIFSVQLAAYTKKQCAHSERAVRNRNTVMTRSKQEVVRFSVVQVGDEAIIGCSCGHLETWPFPVILEQTSQVSGTAGVATQSFGSAVRHTPAYRPCNSFIQTNSLCSPQSRRTVDTDSCLSVDDLRLIDTATETYPPLLERVCPPNHPLKSIIWIPAHTHTHTRCRRGAHLIANSFQSD